MSVFRIINIDPIIIIIDGSARHHCHRNSSSGSINYIVDTSLRRSGTVV